MHYMAIMHDKLFLILPVREMFTILYVTCEWTFCINFITRVNRDISIIALSCQPTS